MTKKFDYAKHDMTDPVDLILNFTDINYRVYNINFNSIESAKKFYRDSYSPGIKLDRKYETVLTECSKDDLDLLNWEYLNINSILDVTINK